MENTGKIALIAVQHKLDSQRRMRPTHHSQTLVKFSKAGEPDGIEKGAWDAPYDMKPEWRMLP
jgi:hypothetical protein